MTFQQLMDCYHISEYENNERSYQFLKEQLKHNNVIPCIGAGISRWAYPGWTSLLYELAEGMGLKEEMSRILHADDPCAYENAASFLEREITRYDFIDILYEKFQTKIMEEKKDIFPEYLKLIPELFKSYIVTTNFDRGIEYIFSQSDHKVPDQVTPLSDYSSDRIKNALHEKRQLIVKLHGDIEDKEHLVFTREAYDDAYGSDPHNPDLERTMPCILKEILKQNVVLFLGCSLEKDRTLSVIHACSGNAVQVALLPLPECTRNADRPYNPLLKQADDTMIPELKKRRGYIAFHNIKRIWYPAGKGAEAVEALLRQLMNDLGKDFSKETGNINISVSEYVMPHSLFGREKITEEIADALLDDKVNSVWLYGAPGIGKTELCKNTYHYIKKQVNDLEMPFVDLTGANGMASFFEQTIRALKISLPNEMEAEEISEWLLNGLLQKRNSSENFILYLDNWEDVWNSVSDGTEKNRLLEWMWALKSNKVKLLVSTRVLPPVDYIDRSFEVSPLEEPDDRELFIKILGRDVAVSEKQSFDTLIKDMDGHPLAIKLTANQAKYENSINDLLDRWHTVKVFNRHAPHESLERALKMSWDSLKSREAVIQWGLHACSIGPIPVKVLEGLQQDINVEDWHKGTSALYQASLTYATPEREAVGMLLPIKKQFVSLVAGTDLETDSLIRWAVYLEGLLDKADDRKREDRLEYHYMAIQLLPQIMNIMERFIKNGDTGGKLDRLCINMTNYYGFTVQSSEVLQNLISFYRTCGGSRKRILAVVLRSRGDLQSRLGQVDEAKRSYSEAERLYRTEHANLGLANVLKSCGDLQSRLGQVDEAKECYSEAEWLYRTEHANLGLANVLQSRGDLQSRLGQVDEAERSYSEAERLYRTEHDNLGLANVLQSRGDLQRRLGQVDEAKECYSEAERLYRTEHANLGLANVLQSRGDLQSRLGQVDEAEGCYSEAERLYRTEHDNLGLANVLQSRGDLQSRLGQVDEAKRSYSEAERLYRTEHDNLGLANVLQSRGDLQRRLGQVDEAERSYSEAERLYRTEHANLGLANVLQSRGDLQRRLGQVDEAERSYSEAERLYRTEHANLGLANVLQSRGDLQRRLGQVDEAKECYSEAERLYRTEHDNLGLANVLKSQGDLLRSEIKYEDAILLYEQAKELYQSEKDDMGLIYTLSELYECYVKTNQWEEAERTRAGIMNLMDKNFYHSVKEYVMDKLKLS